MSLPGVRSAASPEQAARLAKRGCLPSVHERARIFLLLAEVITRISKPQAAADVRKVRPDASAALVLDCDSALKAILCYQVLTSGSVLLMLQSNLVLPCTCAAPARGRA